MPKRPFFQRPPTLPPQELAQEEMDRRALEIQRQRREQRTAQRPGPGNEIWKMLYGAADAVEPALQFGKGLFLGTDDGPFSDQPPPENILSRPDILGEAIGSAPLGMAAMLPRVGRLARKTIKDMTSRLDPWPYMQLGANPAIREGMTKWSRRTNRPVMQQLVQNNPDYIARVQNWLSDITKSDKVPLYRGQRQSDLSVLDELIYGQRGLPEEGLTSWTVSPGTSKWFGAHGANPSVVQADMPIEAVRTPILGNPGELEIVADLKDPSMRNIRTRVFDPPVSTFGHRYASRGGYREADPTADYYLNSLRSHRERLQAARQEIKKDLNTPWDPPLLGKQLSHLKSSHEEITGRIGEIDKSIDYWQRSPFDPMPDPSTPLRTRRVAEWIDAAKPVVPQDIQAIESRLSTLARVDKRTMENVNSMGDITDFLAGHNGDPLITKDLIDRYEAIKDRLGKLPLAGSESVPTFIFHPLSLGGKKPDIQEVYNALDYLYGVSKPTTDHLQILEDLTTAVVELGPVPTTIHNMINNISKKWWDGS
jgi:hypothetical protein